MEKNGKISQKISKKKFIGIFPGIFLGIFPGIFLGPYSLKFLELFLT